MSASLTELRDAAAARAGAVRAAADRPSQRRCAEQPGSLATVRAKLTGLQLREAGGDSTGLDFEGFASVTNAPYQMWDMFGPYTEQVISGAFATTLAQPDLDVPLVLSHDSMRRIARTTNGSLTLTETTSGDPMGLLCQAPGLDLSDADVAYIVPKLRSGLIDEMSFRFTITRGSWSPDWMEYHIEEVDIHRGDVAIVGYGANPHTTGAGLRSKAPAALSDDELRTLEASYRSEVQRRGLTSPMTLNDLLRVS